MELQGGNRMLYPPARWRNPVIRLYHGTTLDDAHAIVADGVAVERGSDRRDFGRGFYTTTLQRQARNWAFEVTRKRRRTHAAVVRFDLARESLASLAALTFVRGDFHASDFWSFVVHCRNGAMHHGRTSRADGCYDMVVGPIAAFWKERLATWDSDQFSFHTSIAEATLNNCPREISWTASR